MSTYHQICVESLAISPHTIDELLGEIRRSLAAKSGNRPRILCINAHISNLARADARLSDILNGSDIVTADGIAVVWGARLLGHPIVNRCNMTEAYHAFLRAIDMPASTAILIGCSDHEASLAAERANASKHCRVVKSYSGYMSEREYENVFSKYVDVDLILLGMGTPKTEYIAELASRICPKAIVWGIGGGTIRIDAGTMNEAPVMMRRLGLQWLYRLGSEPTSLWKRYLFGNPLFIGRILRLWLRRLRQRS